jgi:hypothetical protein
MHLWGVLVKMGGSYSTGGLSNLLMGVMIHRNAPSGGGLLGGLLGGFFGGVIGGLLILS